MPQNSFLADIKITSDPFQVLDAFYIQDEDTALAFLKSHLEDFTPALRASILKQAQTWTKDLRTPQKTGLKTENFLQMYPLSQPEGIALMTIAEALLRIPDAATAEDLIKDKLSSIDWDKIHPKKQPTLQKIISFALDTAKKTLRFKYTKPAFIPEAFAEILDSLGRPFIRHTLEFSMQKMAEQFVFAENMEEALKKATALEKKGLLFSYDMLGEAAYTHQDAEKYLKAYQNAISHLKEYNTQKNLHSRPGISVKLSALYPRYEVAQKERVFATLFPNLLDLCKLAKEANVGITIDAEETDRLILSLEILEDLMKHPSLKGWEGLGLAVQAYQKRALKILDHLENLTQEYKYPLMVRLVKGAYWDSEIKAAQEKGLPGYPVYTRKTMTDLSYIASIYRLFQEKGGYFYPQFATHNAYTAAAVLKISQSLNISRPFEFQKLQGMGDTLYDIVTQQTGVPCRIYAPVGHYKELLPYLIRRLLENGANTSFIHQLENLEVSVEDVLKDPLSTTDTWTQAENPKIPLPLSLFPDRKNSRSFDLTYTPHLLYLKKEMNKTLEAKKSSPSSTLSEGQLKASIETAHAYFPTWANTPVEVRSACLERMADFLEGYMPSFMALCIHEGKKTIPDALSEVREAIDYCRYYALQARHLQNQPLSLVGATGETNILSFHPRGIFACIAPWNFPLAIFLGEIAAALVTGNTVIAKPSSYTTHIAQEVINFFYEAGIPKEALHLAPVSGPTFQNAVLKDSRVKGVVFTGSIQTAQHIAKTLLERGGSLVPLIAETGGINAMIVDSSALPEHVVRDVLISAFHSAGQRCSALRLLCLQDEIFPTVMPTLIGALDAFYLGDPALLSTDMGPLIHKEQKELLTSYIQKAKKSFSCLYEGKVPAGLKDSFVAPHIFEIKKVADLQKEVFGPVLHVLHYKKEDLGKLIEEINALGYGLTMGVQSRLDSTINDIQQHAHVGNLYVNRSMVGAVVGVQPFGGEGLSGTGPKAGGPFYLPRFCVERTLTINTTATGGNTTLLMMENS